MSTFYAVVKKELRSVIREKTIMIAIIIQLLIASFSSIILTGLVSYYDPDSIGLSARISIKVGVIGDADSPLIGFLKDRNLRVTTFPSPAELGADCSIPVRRPMDVENAIRAGTIDAALFSPQDSGGLVNMKLFLPQSEARSTMILMILRGPLKEYENYLREKRGVQVKYSDLKGKPSTTYEFRYSLITPLLLMFFPAFVAGSMVIDSISEELENHTLETLLSAPLSLNVVIGAKIAAALLLALVQYALWSMLLRINGTYVQNLGLVLLLAAVITGIVTVGSALISAYFKDRERSQFAYSLFISISVGAGYFFDASPITLMTRLATGDYYTGVVNVVTYVILLLALLTAFFSRAEKLIAAD